MGICSLPLLSSIFGIKATPMFVKSDELDTAGTNPVFSMSARTNFMQQAKIAYSVEKA